MGSLFKSKTTTTQQPFESNPWKPQQKYLMKGFEAGSGALDKAVAQNGEITDFTADLNEGQLAAIGGLSNLGMGASQDVSQLALRLGLGGAGNFEDFSSNAKDLFAKAGQDPTDNIIANAEKYSSNPHLQGQIDAALGDVRKAFDRDVAGINSAAVGTGNINSTRAGALEARALDDAQDRGAQISAAMRGAAYEGGIDRAMDQVQQNFNNQMGANEALRASGAMGLDFAKQGLQTGAAGYGSAIDANGMLQQQEQNEIAGKQQMSQSEMDLIQRYMGIVGGSYGSQGFQTQVTKQPGLFQSLVGGAASLGGAGFKLPGM